MSQEASSLSNPESLENKKNGSSETSKPNLTLQKLGEELREVLKKIAKASHLEMPDGALTPTVPTQFIGEKDLMLRVDIRAFTKDGEVIRVVGINSLPHVLDDALLPEAPRNFEEMYHASVTRPVLARFNNYIQQFVDRGRDEFRPALPDRGSFEEPTFLTEAIDD
jgi:hypothetical protein